MAASVRVPQHSDDAMTELTQFGADIWITDKPVAPHVDGTAEDCLTYGLVLINTGYVLVYGGKRVKIPPGSVYVIDGRKEHSTEGEGLLALLIWDMPEWTLDDFRRELKQDGRFKSIAQFPAANSDV